jgi:hypothetical protein
LKQDMLTLILLLCFMWQPFILKAHPGVCWICWEKILRKV